MRRAVIAGGIVVTAYVLTPPSASAGIFRGLFRGQRCQTQTYYVQPSPSSTVAPAQTQGSAANGSAQYQSFSYEPGATAPQAMPQAVPQPVNSGTQYRGVYRVEQGHSVPNMFRGDRKMLGLQSN
ncbi:hypothetical protein [Schlesneria paludicola]|uniref:hypothetical protein n=1 Tax=Schlesneria paludicola TaxID=360056 RepID=UPI00029A0F74|nr:hypothetical protein [Schlesneria paludicola]